VLKWRNQLGFEAAKDGVDRHELGFMLEAGRLWVLDQPAPLAPAAQQLKEDERFVVREVQGHAVPSSV
jgi:hypothetical protein